MSDDLPQPTGQCPICSNMIPLHHLELHASGCMGMPADVDRGQGEDDGMDEDGFGLFGDDDDYEDARHAHTAAAPAPAMRSGSGHQQGYPGQGQGHRHGGRREQEETGGCPICSKQFPMWLLERHVNVCMEEMEQAPALYPCGLCQKGLALDDMFVLDECSHKYCRPCIAKHAVQGVYNSLTAVCPQCEAALSARDLQLLLPPKHEIDAKQVNPRKRLMAELKYLKSADTARNGFDVEPREDNLFIWDVKLFGFDNTTDQIARDLNKAGVSHVTLEIKFPNDYPRGPPYIRVISPRFQFMTGHITRGGSVCTELLTNQGWSPANTVEAAIIYVRTNLVIGGARLDFQNTHPYTENEAKEAFTRMLQAHGWN